MKPNARTEQYDPATLNALFMALRRYKQHVRSTSLAPLKAFLTVASRNPATISEVAGVLGAPLSVAKTALDILGEGDPRAVRSSPGRLPPRLIARVDNPVDARSKLAGLTPKGVQLALEMRALLDARK